MAKKKKKQKALKLKRLGKKGGIPIVSEVLYTFLNVTPRPILFLIFIFLITTLATFVVPSVLNVFGYECIQVGNNIKLYQVPMSQLVQKTLLDVKQGVREIARLGDYQLPSDPFPNGDKRFVRVPAQCFTDANINGTTVTGYSSACVDCQKSGFFRYSNSICLSDGNYSPDLVTKYWVGTANFCFQCAPPYPYYFNYSYCFSEDQCFFRILPEFESSVDSIIDSGYQANVYYQRILELGGVERPQDSSQFINIQCSSVDKPELYFFNIEVFNKTMWIYLFCVQFLIGFAFGWYNIVLK